MGGYKLTEQDYWDEYWRQRESDAVEIKRTKKDLSINILLDVFDRFLPVNENFHVLEIGGAPGQYLAYMHKKFKYHAHSLDYSKRGNEQTIKNLSSMGIKAVVYEKDIFADNFSDGLPKFDVVYSLGFIEHFENFTEAVKRHIDLLKPGGILMIGVPNLGGVYKYSLRYTAPKHLAMHNLNAMNISNWKNFESEFGLIPVFNNYITGFEPLIMKKVEIKNFLTSFFSFIIKALMIIFSFRFSFLRKFNSRFWSGYLIGIYKRN